MNQQHQGNWWGRNWKWFVPVGCSSAIILFVTFIVILLTFVFGLMKSSDAYKEALAKVKTHPAVKTSLGTPIEEGMFVTGNISISGPSGQADLAIPVSGPRGKGTVYVVATKSAGQWTFSTLAVEIKKTKERINLLE